MSLQASSPSLSRNSLCRLVTASFRSSSFSLKCHVLRSNNKSFISILGDTPNITSQGLRLMPEYNERFFMNCMKRSPSLCLRVLWSRSQCEQQTNSWKSRFAHFTLLCDWECYGIL